MPGQRLAGKIARLQDFPTKQIFKKKIAFRNSLIYPDADLGFVSEEYTSK